MRQEKNSAVYFIYFFILVCITLRMFQISLPDDQRYSDLPKFVPWPGPTSHIEKLIIIRIALSKKIHLTEEVFFECGKYKFYPSKIYESRWELWWNVQQKKWIRYFVITLERRVVNGKRYMVM